MFYIKKVLSTLHRSNLKTQQSPGNHMITVLPSTLKRKAGVFKILRFEERV